MNTNIPAIDKVFVLVLENRSFDHMLGFSNIQGTDVITGKTRTINGLTDGKYFNLDPQGQLVYATIGASASLTRDPGHEFKDVLEQLCGTGASIDTSTGAYPKLTNSGFVSNYRSHATEPGPVPVMQGFGPGQLSVLESLAREFAVCDSWYSSIPGATWPNRFFFHAASSGGMVESASDWAMFNSTFFQGYNFQHGTIFDLLDAAKIDWCIYEGDAFPQSYAMKGMTRQWIRNKRFLDFSRFARDVSQTTFSPRYVFIEPNYGRDILPPADFVGGNSQHPLDDVFMGEKLIKDVYEAVRNSPHWERSLLVVSYDEHGGFYDHVPPLTAAIPPGDAATVPRQPKFDFRQYGVRVPTIIISPYTARNLIDSTLYDHSSLLRTVELLFDLPTLTDRDANSADFVHLLRSVQQPRSLAPPTVPSGSAPRQMSKDPAAGNGGPDFFAPDKVHSDDSKNEESKITRIEIDIENRLLKPHQYDWLHVAFLRDLAIRQHDQPDALSLDQLRREVVPIRTVGQARNYMETVRQKVKEFKRRLDLL